MNDDETLENKTTNHETEAVKRKKAEKPRPVLDDQWRPPMFLNPWARAFDGDSLPDEPFMEATKDRNNSPTCSQTPTRRGPRKRTAGRSARRKSCDEHERKRT